MRGWFHRSFVLLLAISFIASGATWRQCTAQHVAPAAVAANPAHDHASHAQPVAMNSAVHQHQMAMSAMPHHNDIAAQPASPVPDDHACQKCCGMCSVASVMPATVTAKAMPAVLPAYFKVSSTALAGRVLQLDPGIPRRLS